MTTLYIAEFSSLLNNVISGVDAALMPPLAEQTLTNTGSSAQSAAFNQATRIIRVHTDSICSIKVGPNPTATTSNIRLAVNQTEYFSVSPGDKLAVVLNT